MRGWARPLFVVELLLIGAPLFILSTFYFLMTVPELIRFDLPLTAMYYRLPEPLTALLSWIALAAGLHLSQRYLADPATFGLARNRLAWSGALLGVLLLVTAWTMTLLRPHIQHDEFSRWYGHLGNLRWASPALIPFAHLVVAARLHACVHEARSSEDSDGIEVLRLPLLLAGLGLLVLYALYVFGSNYFVHRDHLPAWRVARLLVTCGWLLLGLGLLAVRHWQVQIRSVAFGALLPALQLALPALALAGGNTPAWLGAFCVYVTINALLCATIRRFENALVLSLLALIAQLLLDGLLLGDLSHFSMKM
ncbi:MAG: hypothetical protein JNN30_02275 [Rhodanobacteraceae bacterium]|nr:hypothetical protein [Rhodanobacteraceae bacterium]